jgi:hypothetical protein
MKLYVWLRCLCDLRMNAICWINIHSYVFNVVYFNVSSTKFNACARLSRYVWYGCYTFPNPSTLGYNYYITFVDAFSRFTWIYLLKSKSDAFPIFQQFRSMVELQFGFPLKAVQTDWGGEFRPFTKNLTDLGVSHRLICPHTHHQNGVVERKHRHIVELGLTLLSHASLPLPYWDYAFLTIVYLINRLPSASTNFKVPYTILFHTDHDYKFLKVFGYACFPLLRPYNNHKLDFRSHECLFLGYSPSHKGYRCLSPTGRLYISKDVIFNESRFTYCDLFTRPGPFKSPPTTSSSTFSLLDNKVLGLSYWAFILVS